MVMRVLLCLWLALLPVAALGQSNDKGYLTNLLEDSLGGDGRDVQINGFSGALSSRARIASITVADEDGIWLSLEDVGINWNRSALLRGRIEIQELSAETITLPRLPVAPDNDLPDVEAPGFALPDLPVSVVIDALKADTIVVGAPVLGEELRMSLEASGRLAGGEGSAKLNAMRSDNKVGQVILEAAFDSSSEQITLDLNLTEEADGVAARLLDLPGQPSVAMRVNGEGPLDDFAMQLVIATDGTERLSGNMSLRAQEAKTPGITSVRRFTANIGGDVTALFAPQYRPFFGEAVALQVTGRRSGDGSLTLDMLQLATDALRLEGQVTLNRDYWPTALKLAGKIVSADGTPVLLPLSGKETRVQEATLDVLYDNARAVSWAGKFDIAGLSRSDIEITQITLDADGILDGDVNAIGKVTATLDLIADGIMFSDDALAEALGSNLAGQLEIDYSEGQPLRLRDLNLAGSDYGLSGDATIGDLDSGFETEFDLNLKAEDMSRFAALSGQALRGSAAVALEGTAALGGVFDIAVDGVVDGLAIGQAQADAVLAGQTRLALRAIRDTTGAEIENLNLRNDQISMIGNARLQTGQADVQFDARLDDVALVAPQIDGPLQVSGSALHDGRGWSVDVEASGPYGLAAVVGGRVTGENTPDIRFNASLPDVRPLVPQLPGGATIKGTAQQTESGLQVATDATGPYGLVAQISGTVTGAAPKLSFSARLPNVASVVPQLSGPLSIGGSARQDGANWFVDTGLEGPVGTTADIVGRVGGDGQLALSVAGNAPLALANPFILPRSLQGQTRFDLRVDGPAALNSVSGQISATQGRLSAPNLRIALTDIAATVGLTRGQANVDMAAQVASGGKVSVRGPLTLSRAVPANLNIALDDVQIVDPALYRTVLNGALSVSGNLTGGARIAGRVDVGETNVSVPSSGLGGFAIVPQIVHVGAAPAVIQTQSRAGLNDLKSSANGATGPAYPLDILVSAPARIFVRGRGLDAELGGQLRLTGTTENIISSGRFELIRGRLDILEKRFNLEEGSVQLQGNFDPFLRFVATTRTSVGTASVIIEGPASEPEVRFESSPEAPQDEVLAQIFFGRDASQLSAFQALQLANAVAVLSGRGGEGIVSKLRKSFDLDDLDVTTDAEGNAALRAGKYISDNVYTDVQVGGTDGAEVSINVDLTPNLTARGKASASGDTSIGIYFEKDY